MLLISIRYYNSPPLPHIKYIKHVRLAAAYHYIYPSYRAIGFILLCAITIMALASFEGRYSKDLFNKSVYTDDSQAPLGYVAKETDDIIVVFSESDKKVRYDIPKSEIAVVGSSVIIQNSHSVLSRYEVKRSAPFPEAKSSRSVAGEQEMDVQARDGLKEAQPEKDRGVEKIKTTSVT
ncbi:MAG: hypothetical protein WBE34_13075, partial [Candidatus Nitrosopolaris sp.]